MKKKNVISFTQNIDENLDRKCGMRPAGADEKVK